jgi:uncharacterized membrane protein
MGLVNVSLLVSLDNWLHLVHVLAAMVWVGGGLMLSIIGARARSSSDPRAIADFARLLPFVGIRVLMPSVILVLVTGVWLVLAAAEFKFTQFWVLLGLGLFAVAFLVGAVYLSRVGIQLDRIGASESQSATGPTGGSALLNRWLIGYWVVLLILLLAVWDMVFKPGT